MRHHGGRSGAVLQDPPVPPLITHGRGAFVYDSYGQDYLDCAAGTFNLSLGYSHPEIVRVIQEQAAELIHVTSSLRAEPIVALERELLRVSPPNLTQVHLKVSGGSTANEVAIRMAQGATGRRGVISMFRSHHGQTVFTTNLSGAAHRRQSLSVLTAGSVIVPDPYCFRCFYGQVRATCELMCIRRLDDFLTFASAGDVACVIVEPISGNGGNIVPPTGYFAGLREFCDRHGIVLIFDEVQTGIGRTGHMFAADHFQARPDIIVTAKGLGGSGAQIAAVLASDAVADAQSEKTAFTFGGNVLAAAAAVRTVQIVSDPEFLANVRAVGQRIMRHLTGMAGRFPCIGDVRGVGLMIGIEVVDANGRPDLGLTSELAARAPDFGLLLRTSHFGRGNVIKIRPALNLPDDEAEMLVDRLGNVFEAVAS